MITPIQKRVPNFQKGRGLWKPDCIVIHIAEGLRESVYTQFLTNQVSTHYLVNKDGSVWQFVDEKDTAWGNGKVSNPTSALVKTRPVVNPNIYTISIEHEGFAEQGDISELMYQTTIELVKEISNRWDITLDRTHLIGHKEITDNRTCPNPISVDKILAGAQQGSGGMPPTQPTAKQLLLEIEQKIAKLKTLLP